MCIEDALAFEESIGESVERFEEEIVEICEVVPHQAVVDTRFLRDNSHRERGMATLYEQAFGGIKQRLARIGPLCGAHQFSGDIAARSFDFTIRHLYKGAHHPR